MRHLALLLLLLSSPLSARERVDDWVPYNDGRLGGCYRTVGGRLYGCTPQRRPAAPPVAPADAAATMDNDELATVKLELEALKQRQADEDARRAMERAELDAVANAATAAEQQDIDAALAAYNAIESAKDAQRMRELERRTEACRATIEAKGFRIVAPGACHGPDDSYTNCPEC